MTVDAPIRRLMQRWECPGDIHFATFSCQRRLPLFKNHRICEVFLDAMAQSRARLGTRVFAWLLMPDHVHVMMQPREDATSGRVLRSIKMSVAKRVISRWRELEASILQSAADSHGSPRFWQTGGGFDRNVRDEYEFAREIQYIHRNPVEAGLVTNASDWPWSSVRWWMGKRAGEFECDDPPGGPEVWKEWNGYV